VDRILNGSVGEFEVPQYCPWCDNSGWLYLHRKAQRKAQNGTPYEEQVMAGCGFCQVGHEKHRRFGGAWDYRMEEIDVSLTDDAVKTLGPEQQAVYERIQAAGEAIRKRSVEMQLPTPFKPKLDGEFYAEVDPEFAHLGSGPGPATMVGQGPDGQTPSPETDIERGTEP
jgi:hypothetical protein